MLLGLVGINMKSIFGQILISINDYTFCNSSSFKAEEERKEENKQKKKLHTKVNILNCNAIDCYL